VTWLGSLGSRLWTGPKTAGSETGASRWSRQGRISGSAFCLSCHTHSPPRGCRFGDRRSGEETSRISTGATVSGNRASESSRAAKICLSAHRFGRLVAVTNGPEIGRGMNGKGMEPRFESCSSCSSCPLPTPRPSRWGKRRVRKQSLAGNGFKTGLTGWTGWSAGPE
jgi:hypothetical protein